MRSVLVFVCISVWLATASAGVFYLARYEVTPDAVVGVYPPDLPHSTPIQPDSGRPTLIFFAHPKCPCTRAAVRELAKLLADTDGKLTAYVVITKPQGVDDDWTSTDLRYSAERIPGVRVLIDDEERLARLFNAQTSSLTLLYDASGTLRFNGGITAGRGHEGDNAGRDAIFDIVTSGGGNDRSAAYGCPLLSRDCDAAVEQ